MQTEEGRKLTERIAQINSIRQRDFLAVFLALIVGLETRLVAWYLFKTGIIHRLNRLTANARALRRGDSLPYPQSDRKDALCDLEQEIVLVGKQFPSPGAPYRGNEL